MMSQKSLYQCIELFFQEHLAAHRGVSSNTVKAYRDAIKIFLLFVSKTRVKHVTKIGIEEMTADAVLEFLDEVESVRGCSAGTRNHRLAALRVFFSYLATQSIMRIGQFQKILTIPQKRAAKPMMGYLEVDEVSAILKAIDRSTWAGRRDYFLLSLLYNTGARVQEICDLKPSSFRTDSPPLVTIRGKGKKTRQVPLWPETNRLLTEHLDETNLLVKEDAPIFCNLRGQPIGRFGVRYIVEKRVRAAAHFCPKLVKKTVGPHTFRHTTAMHLLQSGVELTVIRSWLGHVDIATTHGYVEIDMEMKRKALEKCNPGSKSASFKHLLKKHKDIVGWLEAL